MNGKMIKCATCGNEIAADAKVCPQCGSKNKKAVKKPMMIALIVFVVIVVIGSIASTSESDGTENADNKEIITQEDKVVENSDNKFTGDCGITASAEMGTDIIGMPELSISITNVSEKDIAAVKFYAVPCDVYGDEIKGWTRQDKLYTDTTITAGASDSLTYSFIEESVKTVKLYVYSVYFKDGTEWGNKDATTSEIVKNGRLIEVSGES